MTERTSGIIFPENYNAKEYCEKIFDAILCSFSYATIHSICHDYDIDIRAVYVYNFASFYFRDKRKGSLTIPKLDGKAGEVATRTAIGIIAYVMGRDADRWFNDKSSDDYIGFNKFKLPINQTRLHAKMMEISNYPDVAQRIRTGCASNQGKPRDV